MTDKIVVQTKLSPPSCQDSLLNRDTLLQRLQDGRANPLTLITGSGGYGKTTLAILWRRNLVAQEHDVGWFGIAPADNDLNQFVVYFSAAIDMAAPGIGREAITLFNLDSSNSTELFIAALINDVQQYHRDIYITLDDYHHIKSPAIHNLLQDLLAMMPANLHLVIISRVNLPLELERLRAYSRITEINFSDLRLSYEEAGNFVASQGLSVGAKQLKAFYEQSDGWIIGLQLFCFSLKKNPDFGASNVIQFNKNSRFSHYLEAEILSQLPPKTVDFMVKIAASNRFNADFAAFLTQSDHADAILRQLEAENIFILPLDTDDGLRWYRFHPLMRTALVERLSQLPAIETKALNQRACKWLLDHGLISEAVRHAIYSKEYTMAADLIGTCGRQVVLQGQLKTLLSWSDQIPATYTLDNLTMQLPLIWALVLSRRLSEASTRLQQLEDSGVTINDNNRLELKLLQALICFSKDNTQGILQTLAGVNEISDDYFLHAVGTNLRSLAYCHTGEYEKARDIQISLVSHESDTFPSQRKVVGGAFVGLSFAMQGYMLQAEQACRKALNAAVQQLGNQPELVVYASSVLSEVLYELGQWEEARRLTTEHLDIIDHVAPPDGVMRSYMVLCRIARQTDQVNEARSYIESFEDLGASKGLDRLFVAALFEGVLLALQEGNVALVEENLRRMERLAVFYAAAKDCAFAEIPIFHQLARLEYQFYLQQWDAVLEIAATVLPAVKRKGRLKLQAGVELRMVMALDLLDKKEEALDKLAECLTLCQRLGLFRTVVDAGDRILILANELTRRVDLIPVLRGYIEKLIAAALNETKPQSSARIVTNNRLIEPLSKRELEVLRRLPQASTNKKLALLLDISRDTVKYHLKNIYGKLGVASRDEAVARGRDLHLVD